MNQVPADKAVRLGLIVARLKENRLPVECLLSRLHGVLCVSVHGSRRTSDYHLPD